MRITDKCYEIKKSNFKGAGTGLFATCEISKNSHFDKNYHGKKLTENEYQNLSDESYVWQVNGRPTFYINGIKYKKDNPLRYVNGAFNKKQKKLINTEMYQYGKKVWYRTTKKVKPGEEFVIDYGDVYWNP